MSRLDASVSEAILAWQYQVKSVTAHLPLLSENIHTAMKINLSLSAPAILCLALASCYPIQDRDSREPAGPEKKKSTSEETVSSSSQQKVQEQREKMKKKQAVKKRETTSVPKEKPKTESTSSPSTKPKPKNDYAFANPVPGKDGFVFSPYNNKLVDVRDIPSGTLVQDPTYPASEKKYFRVP